MLIFYITFISLSFLYFLLICEMYIGLIFLCSGDFVRVAWPEQVTYIEKCDSLQKKVVVGAPSK